MPATPDPGEPSRRRLRLRYPAICANCALPLSKGTEAFWNSETREVTCLACGNNTSEPIPDLPGGSAACEGERRLNRRIDEVRRRHGDYAAEVARTMGEREVADSWLKGSDGEARLAAFIDREVGDSVIALHDRLIPGTRGNIDHIWVASTGVWVVDAKSYGGKLSRREVGPFWRRDNEVFVSGRNRTNLAKGVERQVNAVLAALRPDPDLKGIDVHGALCFVDSDWDLLAFPFQVGTIWVMYPGALRRRLKKSSPLARDRMERAARRLDLSLPRANAAM